MTPDISLKPATAEDQPFVESVYFETQRWIIEELFGWRGHEFEHAKFRSEFYRERNSSVILVDNETIGWIAVKRNGKAIHLDGIYLSSKAQRKGIGTALLRGLTSEAMKTGLPLTLRTAKINPATALYERLGFTRTVEDGRRVYMAWWPKGNLNFSAANERDAPDVARLHHLVRETSMPYLPKLHTIEESERFFEGVIASRSVVLAKTGDLLIGYCAYGDGWLDQLYVHPDYQGLRVGSALLNGAMTAERNLALWVFQKNAVASRFYQRFGFKLLRATDGRDNEEREPDALYAWEAE
jgi:GNAT superfamily N-acetyltransferase